MPDSRLIVEGVDPQGRKMRIWHLVSLDSNEYVLFRERLTQRRGVVYATGDVIARAPTQDEICEKALALGFSHL